MSRTISQRTMQSPWLPFIYEKLWRPVGFTVAAGGRGTKAEQRTIERFLNLSPADHVLDVACGPGNTTRRLVAGLGTEGRVTGFDLAPMMIDRARADTSDPRVDYVLGDGGAMPFGDANFNAVTCFGALYLVDDAEAVIDEMVRVVKPGGRVVVLTSVIRGPAPCRAGIHVIARPSGLRVFGRDEVTGAFAAHGLVDINQDIHGVVQIVGGRKPA